MRLFSSALLIFLLWFTGGCVPNTVSVTTVPQFNPTHIQTLAIVPFQAISTPQGGYRGSQAYPPPDPGPSEYHRSFELTPTPVLGRLSTKTITVPAGTPNVIARMIFTTLNARSGVKLVPLSLSAEAMNQLESSGVDRHAASTVQQLGQTLSADAVLLGLVRVYRERDGSRIGATPAAVGFEVQLVETKTGSVLWTGNYYEEQKPLSEDLLGFLERGGAFVTAEELAQSGVNRMMKQLPLGVQPSSEPAS